MISRAVWLNIIRIETFRRQGDNTLFSEKCIPGTVTCSSCIKKPQVENSRIYRRLTLTLSSRFVASEPPIYSTIQKLGVRTMYKCHFQSSNTFWERKNYEKFSKENLFVKFPLIFGDYCYIFGDWLNTSNEYVFSWIHLYYFFENSFYSRY